MSEFIWTDPKGRKWEVVVPKASCCAKCRKGKLYGERIIPQERP